MVFDFDDLERTLPPEDSTSHVEDRRATEDNDNAFALFRRGGVACSASEATSWKQLDKDLCDASRSLKMDREQMEIDTRRGNLLRRRASGVGSHFVSVICPTTGGRRCFHGFLWECYSCQTYPSRELIVIETSDDGPSQFWLQMARERVDIVYRHFRVPVGGDWCVGLKRNLACCFAIGDIVAHFDDDDIYAPGYLDAMVQRLMEPSQEQLLEHFQDGCPKKAAAVRDALGRSGAACAKLASWLKFSIRYGTWGVCDPCRSMRDPHSIEKCDPHSIEKCLFGWGFSLVYLRAAWLMCPFPHRRLGEDYDFLQGLRRTGFPVVLVQGAEWICAHTQHGENTSGRLMEFSEPLSMAESVLRLSPLAPLLDQHEKMVGELIAAQKLPRNRTR